MNRSIPHRNPLQTEPKMIFNLQITLSRVYWIVIMPASSITNKNMDIGNDHPLLNHVVEYELGKVYNPTRVENQPSAQRYRYSDGWPTSGLVYQIVLLCKCDLRWWWHKSFDSMGIKLAGWEIFYVILRFYGLSTSRYQQRSSALENIKSV